MLELPTCLETPCFVSEVCYVLSFIYNFILFCYVADSLLLTSSVPNWKGFYKVLPSLHVCTSFFYHT